MFARKFTMTIAGAGVAFVMAAAPASAHFCFKTHDTANGAAGKAGSSGWATFAELAASELPGLCDAGIDLLAEAAGATADTPIKTSGVMAGGTLKKEEGGNKSIDHLDFAALEAAIPDAFAVCAD